MMSGTESVTSIAASRAMLETAPLSFEQQQIWAHSLFAPEVPLYNDLLVIHRHGPLDIAALTACLEEIARRHQPWRSSFSIAGDQPVQTVHPSARFEIPHRDFRHLPEAQLYSEAAKLVGEWARKPFQLNSPPLVRILVLQLDDAEYQICISLHRLVSDGFSLRCVLLPELVSLYEAFADGRSSRLPQLLIEYAQFAVRQRETLARSAAPETAFWRKQLGGLPVLELSTDSPRPAVQSFRGAAHRFALSETLSKDLRELGHREAVPLETVLTAAFAAVLYRHSEQDDIVIGVSSNGRNTPELQGLLGYFENSLALRLDLSGDPSFLQLLHRTEEARRQVFDNGNVPLTSVIREIEPGRDLIRNPITRVHISQIPAQTFEHPDWRIASDFAETNTANFDLELRFDDGSDALQGQLRYNADIFEASTVERIADRWKTLLDAIADSPAQTIALLPLLTGSESALLAAWNQTQHPYPSERCIHQLVQEQVERTPQAIALVQEKQTFTYAQLNARANQLARYLRKRGVGPEICVGVSLRSKPELVVALLGVLKAGGACVPLDPKYPAERLEYMIRDAQLPVLITEEDSVAAGFSQAAEIITFSEDAGAIGRESSENLDNLTTPQNLAYLIYTSGSTGRPRGVLLPHAALVNHNTAVIALYCLTPSDRVLQFSSISFDIALEEIFPTLMSGATLVLKTDEMPLEAAHFLRWIDERGVTILDLPTAYWHELAHAATDLKRPLPSRLRLVIVGGEKASVTALASWRKATGERVRWVNTYGPTETSVIVTSYEPGGSIPDNLPIGRPIANTQIHILDKSQQKVPIGVRGELHIGGVGVARGYLNHPELTAQKFIADPFCSAPGAKLYKTGDLARYLPNGDIEFLGRNDYQVKIRGFRVELGEIEAALDRHPQLKEAVVVARDDSTGTKNLIAFFVPNQESPTASELRSFLKQTLPDYMVPSAFVRLTAMPMTPNGKLDRRGLPQLQPADLVSEDKPVPARDALESQLVGIWQSLLPKRPIGIRDNFFEVGGHSLLAVRLMHRIEQVFGKQLPIATLLHAPTIEELANVLRQKSWSPSWSSLVPIQPNGSRPPIFCVHGAGGAVMVYRELAGHLGPEQPVYGLQAQGLDGKQPYLTTVEEMAAHYLSLIRTVQPQGPYFIGGLSFGGTVAYEMAQRLHANGEQVALLFMFDTFPGTYETNVSLLLKLSHMPRREQADYVTRKIRQYVMTLGRRFNRLFFPESLKNVRKGIEQAGFRYQMQPYPGSMVLFRAKEKSLRGAHDPYAGWRDLAHGGVEVYEIPGGHVSILAEPQVQILTKHLRSCIERASAEVVEQQVCHS